MAKTKTTFICTGCGYESGKWMGRCPGCGEWNTMEEQTVFTGNSKSAATPRRSAQAVVQRMVDIDLTAQTYASTGIGELDRVLGGGLVEGAVVLVGGEPGVGKSTLLLQACENLAQSGHTVLYVSGEESARQVKMRAQRLGVRSENLYMLAETDMDVICTEIEKRTLPVVVIDSIQTMNRAGVSSSLGSVSQVRECAALALRVAKETGASVLLVGHVTKEGALAGPRVLEHMVDTVLYFEGERHSSLRILRAVKNRFGSTNEIGVFEMTAEGMREMTNPSAMLISQHTRGVAGSAVTCSLEGTRPVLSEIQALAATTTFGQPRRMATGVDYNRMLLMIAVLERSAGIALYNRDVYVNAVGGLRLNEPANDLAMATAIASAATGRPLREGFCVIGEIGLTGEIRSVSQLERRASECGKMGFTHILVPRDAVKGLQPPQGTQWVGVRDIVQVLGLALQPVHRQNPSEESGKPAQPLV